VRCFSSAASKVAKSLQGEIKHEEENYEPSKEIKTFLKDLPFKFIEADGDVNMTLERDLGEKVVRIEWQLTSPFDPEMGGEEDGEPEKEATDVSITVESKDGARGMTFYCSTQTGEDHRYVIGNMKTFSSLEEKDSMTSYNGPEFEDLDDKLQEAFDEYLAEVGMSSDVCDFIDAMAVDKEQREYVRWLKNTAAVME
jgi:complement component 1 Q subcomponent-binding protein